MKITKIIPIIIIVLSWVCSFAFAEIPHAINYQGKLTNSAGAAVSDGSYSVTFSIYEQVSGGTPIWYETQSVSVSKGIFSTQIGATKDLNLAFDKSYYLGIKVGTDAEMAPRQPLTSSAYAFKALKADAADNSEMANLAQNSNNLNNQGGQFYLDRSNHTGIINYEDLDPSIQNFLNSGSKTVAAIGKGIGGNFQAWYVLSTKTINLLINKTVNVAFSIEGYSTELYNASSAANFQILINGTVAGESGTQFPPAGNVLSFTGGKDCTAGNVEISVQIYARKLTLKHGIMVIEW